MRIYLLFFISAFGFCQQTTEIAQTLIENKQYAQAEKELLSYIENNTSNLKAIELLGDSYAYQSKWKMAMQRYQFLVSQQPKNANYHYKYGGAMALYAKTVSKIKALSYVGDIKHAFKTAANLDATHIDVRWALVDLYVSLPGIVGGSYKKALKYAGQLQELSKIDGYLAKGYVYEYDNEPELAEKNYKEAVLLVNNKHCNYTADVRNALRYQIGKVSADYNMILNNGEKCLNTYIKNYTAKDGVPLQWAYYRLAQIYKHKQNKTLALKFINKALNIRPNFKQALKEKKHISKI